MSDLLSYKNYNGTVEYSSEDRCLFGKVVGIKSLLSYEGDSIQELEQDFQIVIDEYLEDCKERNVQPEQPYKGSFNIRIRPELHRGIAVYAIEHEKSLNAVVEEAISNLLNENFEPEQLESKQMSSNSDNIEPKKALGEKTGFLPVSNMRWHNWHKANSVNNNLSDLSFKWNKYIPLIVGDKGVDKGIDIPILVSDEIVSKMINMQNSKDAYINLNDELLKSISWLPHSDEKEENEQVK